MNDHDEARVEFGLDNEPPPANPEPPEGLRAAAEAILDLIDTSAAEGDDSMPLYDFLDSDSWHPAIDALRAALAHDGEGTT